MIGYYAHHRGAGHVHRAQRIAAALSDDVTILSSVERPDTWAGEWVRLPLDHGAHDARPDADITAHGAVHWAPLSSDGLRDRMAALSSWLRSARPSVVVVDVSVEVAMLVRLHGIRVVTIAQPGDRTDAAHTLGYRASSAIIAAWPEGYDALALDPDVASRLHHVGAISRIPTVEVTIRDPRQVAVLSGYGMRGPSQLDAVVERARAAAPDLRWVTLAGVGEAAVASVLRTSGVVLAHCGENAIAEIAASRVPAVLVPEHRPYDEQRWMAHAIARGRLPVTVLDSAPRDWSGMLADTSALDAGTWDVWCDGHAAERAAAIIERVADEDRALAGSHALTRSDPLTGSHAPTGSDAPAGARA